MKKTKITNLKAIEITEAMQVRHEHHLKEGEFFEVSGYTTAEEAYSKMVLKGEESGRVYPVECKIDLSDEGHPSMSEEEALYLLLDFQDYYLGRYLAEDRNLFLPIMWDRFEFEQVEILAKGQVFNEKLEDLAEQWLAGKIKNN